MKRLYHRWVLWLRGPCRVEGCTNVSERFGRRCWPHEIEHVKEVGRQIAAEQFEREVQIHTEALRRFARDGQP